jgi:16S rRNA (guanine966-N2)-methyltransferase
LSALPIHREPIETIHFNVEHTGFARQSEIRRGDAFTLLSRGADAQFEYIYIAPPQYKEMWEKALELVDEDIRWLSEDGWVIVQIDPREYKKVSLQKLEEFEQRKYGSTMLIFYERKLEPETVE